MITVTEAALNKIADILAEENKPQAKIRAFVQGGGCAGFQYGFTIDLDINEDDFVIEKLVVIDAASMQYLEGSTIDYKEEMMESRFVIQNPNSSGSCGCGSSFSI